MARKTRQRISYVLPLPNATAGHRLGVNALVVDAERSILYSGGRDGVIYAWDVDSASDGKAGVLTSQHSAGRRTVHRQHVQAHTHWINDLVLAQSSTALVSASSDISVKLWRPHAERSTPPQTIGLHSDYVKCIASPAQHSTWVASGGLDRRICLWDLSGAGLRSQIQATDEEASDKGSIYALAANESLMASGGPENVVKVWDPRSARRVTKFVGHTDNVRSILLSSESDLIISASSDQTIKVWSMLAGRCLNTLTMHDDSVWSLFSNHPQLSVFYSGDRSGFVAKTDTRGAAEFDDGLSLALCKEHEGITKLVSFADQTWTATSSSSINRWSDIDMSAGVQPLEHINRTNRWNGTTRLANANTHSLPNAADKIPVNCILRISNSNDFVSYRHRDFDRNATTSGMAARRVSNAVFEAGFVGFAPLRSLPEETIEGQNGLIKHILLNDRRRVLTLDSAGEVLMWDLLQCIPTKSFGKHHLEDIIPRVNTNETFPHWCAVDTRTGTLTCVLEENYCFDAEMYADEVADSADFEFREDQRINLGRWVLRNLFSALIEEELRRDDHFRKNFAREKRRKDGTLETNRDTSDGVTLQNVHNWQPRTDLNALPTPRATYSLSKQLMTPGLSIGVVTPGQIPVKDTMSPVSDDQSAGLKTPQLGIRLITQPQNEYDVDYFTSKPSSEPEHTDIPVAKNVTTPSENRKEASHSSSTETDRQSQVQDSTASFGKRLRMSFGTKKTVRSQVPDVPRPAPVEENSIDSDEKFSKPVETPFEDTFWGTIQRVRQAYAEIAEREEGAIKTMLAPSTASETPFLKQPATTTVIIQEEKPDSAGVVDLFEGSLGELGRQADLIEKVAPMWLGDLLLLNRIPPKEIVKVSFTLEPYQKLLPYVTDNEGTERLNANRMLRARKVLAYIIERLDIGPSISVINGDRPRVPPEEMLELYCQDQLIQPTMTLASIRAHVWRGAGDVALVYRRVQTKESGSNIHQ